MYETSLEWARKQKSFTIWEMMAGIGCTYIQADMAGLRLETERVCTHMDEKGARHVKGNK